MFSKNITIDHLGQIIIELGDYFSFPKNFEKLFSGDDNDFDSVFKISFADNPFHKLNYTIKMVSYTTSKIVGTKRAKKMEEKSIKELVGTTVKEFEDLYWHGTNANKTPHIIIFKITFRDPWSVSVNKTDVLNIKICK